MRTVELYTDKNLKEAFEAGVERGKNLAFINGEDRSSTYQEWINHYRRGNVVEVDEVTHEKLKKNYHIEVVNGTKPLSITAIIKAVSQISGVSQERLKRWPGREPEILTARYLAYYLCYYHVSKPLKEIGKVLGRKTHGTIIVGAKKNAYFLKTYKCAQKNLQLVYSILKKMGYNTEYYVHDPSSDECRNVYMQPRKPIQFEK